MDQSLPLVVMGLLAVLFAGISLTMSRLLSRKRPNAAKSAPYECGIVPSKEPPQRFPVSFYLVAMLFIMFDIEIVFLYPYAVSHGTLGAYGFWAIMVFSVDLLPLLRVRGGQGRPRLGAGQPGPAAHGDGVARAHDAHHRAARGPRGSHRGAERGDRGVSEPAEMYQASGATFADDGVAGLAPQLPDGQARGHRAVGPLPLHVGRHVRAGVLRHRDDGRGRLALRPGPLRHGGLPGLAPSGRHHDRGRSGQPEDGAGPPPGLRPDDGPEVGHLHGRVRLQRRHVQQLRHRAGRRPGGARSTCTRRAALPPPRRSSTPSRTCASSSPPARSCSGGPRPGPVPRSTWTPLPPRSGSPSPSARRSPSHGRQPRHRGARGRRARSRARTSARLPRVVEPRPAGAPPHLRAVRRP